MVALVAPLVAYVTLEELSYVPSKGAAGIGWFALAFATAFVGGWLVWAVQVPRWRLWAYRRVGNIRALKRLAVAHQYVWPEGSVFERTEIMSAAVRAELRSLERGTHGT
jgi:hypothetical protein